MSFKSEEEKGVEIMVGLMNQARPYQYPTPVCPYHGEEMEEIEIGWAEPWNKKSYPLKVWVCHECVKHNQPLELTEEGRAISDRPELSTDRTP